MPGAKRPSTTHMERVGEPKNEMKMSGTLGNLIDAASLNKGALGKFTEALTGENDRAEECVRLIGEYIYRSHRMRMTDDDAGAVGNNS
ncbi:hypothetical protein ACQUSY_08670 [Microbacterium sp. YY-03]|uniref:hypothetical protein n=1 Tax=Microbacterium sp. YY-03 TaxID=3421636 RepID=UPI003D1739D4